ncbi:hypothetical protein KJ641_01575 [Patescibacteria group bacterium]|nr:hypothetical protein [Patescibacteria group bacterium]MBU1895542.1 hypothetical protein [Patescibacteria group bacterium]
MNEEKKEPRMKQVCNLSLEKKWGLIDRAIKTLLLSSSVTAERLYALTRGEENYGCRDVFVTSDDIENVLFYAKNHGRVNIVDTVSGKNGNQLKFALIGAKVPRYEEGELGDGKPPGGKNLCKRLVMLYDALDGKSETIGSISPDMAGYTKNSIARLRRILEEGVEFGYFEIEKKGAFRILRWSVDPSEFLPDL